MENSMKLFVESPEHNYLTWNTMIVGYVQLGDEGKALNMFVSMLAYPIQPTEVTYSSVLRACASLTSLKQGHQVHSLTVKTIYDKDTVVANSLVDMYTKCGIIRDARIPSVMVWRALLGAWLLASSTIILSGRVCAQRVLEMDPHDDATHILLSNMYATARRWDSVASIRKIMHTKRVRKEPGLSWIEDQGVVHYFTAGNTRHPDIKLISAMLECERLALSFGLIQLPHGCPIHIIKNLRICVDCHIVMKLISKIVQRDIIIRDMNRFYHFQHGTCSCDDYW
ncbi:hypothetical protein K1719_012385 [Acacia pycnantha]|nr:hypothetical protein K1719_012385 [Acacia pycnantha]